MEILVDSLSEKAEMVSISFSGLWGRLFSAPGYVLNYKPDPQATAFKVCK